MAYQPDIARMTEEVLRLPEIRRAIDDPTSIADERFLRAKITQDRETIFAEVASWSKVVDSYELEVRNKTERLNEQIKTPPQVRLGEQLAFAIVIGIANIVVWGGIAWLFGAFTLTAVWANIKWLAAFVPDPFLGVAASALVVISFYGIISRAAWNRNLPELTASTRASLDLDAAEQRLQLAKAEMDSAFNGALMRHVTGLTNPAISYFQATLFVPTMDTGQPAPGGNKATTGRGLSEVLNPLNEIATEARQRILHMLRTLPGGSIGVAGPRGVGKSTLLASLCATNPTIDGREAIAVYTSAPVEYDPRDFLLHVFATLCRQVLKTKGAQEDKSLPVDEINDPKTMRRRFYADPRRLGWFLAAAGGVLLVAGMIYAGVLADIAQQSQTTSAAQTSATPTAQTPPAPAAQSPATPPAQTPGTPPAQPGAPAAKAPTTASGADFVKALDLKPGPIVTWGILALLLGLFLIVTEAHGPSDIFPFIRPPAPTPSPLRIRW